MKTQIPAAINKHRIIGAKVVVSKFLELVLLVPDKTKWAEEILKNHPPAYYRLIQLKCLCRVFKIGSIDSFLNGNFIFERDPYTFRHYFSMRKSGDETRRRNEENEKMGLNTSVSVSLYLTPETKEDMQYIADTYKMHIYFLERFYDIQNGKESLFFDEDEKEHHSFIIEKATQNICQLVSPNHEKYLIGDLIEKHDCPDVNVYALDELYK